MYTILVFGVLMYVVNGQLDYRDFLLDCTPESPPKVRMLCMNAKSWDIPDADKGRDYIYTEFHDSYYWVKSHCTEIPSFYLNDCNQRIPSYRMRIYIVMPPFKSTALSYISILHGVYIIYIGLSTSCV